MKRSYQGIDGRIGNPPRPLQLKQSVAEANANQARFHASAALKKAKKSGVRNVEVHIEMEGKTIAEVKAAWNAPPPRSTDPPNGPVYEGNWVSKVVVTGTDGTWVVPK